MRRATIATMDNGLPVQCVSERDFLFALLRAGSPEDAVAAFPYLSDLEKTFALRGLFENWTRELAGGWDGLPPHLMAWVERKRLNGHAGDDTPGSFDA
jgi:hypothetical protein